MNVYFMYFKRENTFQKWKNAFLFPLVNVVNHKMNLKILMEALYRHAVAAMKIGAENFMDAKIDMVKALELEPDNRPCQVLRDETQRVIFYLHFR